ncbi:uncharacterized protein LOC132706816 [Cylas formicarius]|uniref:uncharacterized protein LOC132706816 n=1 Tax=Cylas formicarius TaxID=197179 RepID=UPI0029589E51|nr:uncharacterized protein LOC132706816 [Cylas formicarius]
MVWSPIYNLTDFLKNKPPLIVVLLCLVALAVSTFYYAFEIQDDGATADSDKKHDWLQMLKSFNKLDTCLQKKTWTQSETNSDKEISVFTLINLENPEIWSQYSEIEGFLTLEGFHFVSCKNSEIQPQSLKIVFSLPPLTKQNTSSDICATIVGPAEYLPQFVEANCKPYEGKSSKVNKGYISSKPGGKVDQDFCRNGESQGLHFSLEQNDIANYLNDDVRVMIYVHLMWCSYILVFIIFCIIIYALCCRKVDYKKEFLVERIL